ncbi:cytochrome c oxidase subunit 5b-1, mitochondrial-like isoform X2 [Malania oleifera]|uniref:cytochrome c oxidase subunit 5b-1, mitochondrial-like isoform X2 n=1 Tax=Malania oleifera TaxID=397392 RepID=UPI0025ADC553|nr:cytochrome c oxidase subunit 5b-1, mitochondrial-like isoform X2 [Malania oleifera]
MSRKVVATQLQTLNQWRSALKPNRSVPARFLTSAPSPSSSSSSPTTPFRSSAPSHHAISDSENFLSRGMKKVDDIMPIATGHEREELAAELEGKNILEINYPVGPFGTKEAPAIVKSVYDKRIVGCPGGEGEDEHDVVWFWLEKGKPHECPVCSQYFKLEVVGPGGSPDGHGDNDHH